MFLKTRRRQPELMDDPGLDDDSHYRALRGLQRVNRWSGTAAVLETAIRTRCAPLLEQLAADSRPLSILDIACGGGDLAVQLGRRLHQAGVAVTIAGCDISPTAIEYATALAAQFECTNVRFFEHDIVTENFEPQSYDVVISTLFMHHLDEVDARRLLRVMQQTARHLVLVDDLQRTPLGYVLAWTGCRLLSRSRVVRTDGPLSVQGAFTVDETQDLAAAAGLSPVTLTKHWPERFLMAWERVT